jgi:SAM-dependent methyltransferase
MIEALGIAMVKNEADVIEAFVRHNLGFMDALAIADNDSIDGTREILVQLQQEGLPIILFDNPVVGHFHAEIMIAVYRKVVPKFKPRFVFLLDADEFIVASSRDALYVQLRAMRPGTQAQYCWRTYVPAPTGPEGDPSDPLRSITHRKVVEHDPRWKAVIVTKPKIDMKLKIVHGNHGATYAGRLLRRAKLHDVVIAHFPVRSVDQITSKILVGWIANLERDRYLPGHYADHWKPLYERIIRGAALTTEDLTREALRYAQFSGPELKWPQDVVREPVVPGYARLTARPTTTSTPLQKVLRSIDKIFNPEADFSGLATGIEFLQNSKRKSRTWREFVRPFTTADRAGTELYVDLPPFRLLAQRDCPASVLDIGCRSGAYLKYFASQGASLIRGVDSSERRARYLQLDEYVQVDLGKPVDLAQTFDLVICVEVIQHIPAQSECTLISSITRHARERIVFSGARAGQPGAGHINCRPISHWLDLFASAGWYPCLFDSLALRSLSTFPWFRSNLVVLTRAGHDAAVARERLMELEQQEIKWSKQRPAVITHSFTETAAKLLAHPDSRTVAVANALQRTLARVVSIRADTDEVVILGRTTTDWGTLRHRKPQELRRRG